MNAVSLPRRAVLGGFLGLVVSRTSATAGDGILPAIRRAKTADAAFLRSGSISVRVLASGASLPAGWMAYRETLRLARYHARHDLNALTPATPREATALVAYYSERAARSGDPAAFTAARRRLRKVFRRPGAPAPVGRHRPRRRPPPLSLPPCPSRALWSPIDVARPDPEFFCPAGAGPR